MVQSISGSPGCAPTDARADSVLPEHNDAACNFPAVSLPGCRFCGSRLRHTFADLGMSPLSNAYLSPKQLNQMEPFYPLCVRVCAKCFLVQLEELEHPEKIFGDYAYFSSYSESWLRHARDYCARMIDRFNLGENSLVVEVASNDGYLLQYFQRRGIRVLGIEPARNVALAAREKRDSDGREIFWHPERARIVGCRPAG